MRTGVNPKRNFDILQIILRQREYSVFHTCRCSTTAKIHDLEHFMNFSASNCFNRTGACNITISIQLSTIVNSNATAFIHSNMTIFVRRYATHITTIGIFLFRGNTYITIDDQFCAIRHRQCAICTGLGISTCVLNARCIHCI